MFAMCNDTQYLFAKTPAGRIIRGVMRNKTDCGHERVCCLWSIVLVYPAAGVKSLEPPSAKDHRPINYSAGVKTALVLRLLKRVKIFATYEIEFMFQT